MKVYQAEDEKDFVDSLIKMLEQDTKKEIFTIRILEHKIQGLETIIVFKDKTVMLGMIKVGTVKGKIAIRMQGNYV